MPSYSASPCTPSAEQNALEESKGGKGECIEKQNLSARQCVDFDTNFRKILRRKSHSGSGKDGTHKSGSMLVRVIEKVCSAIFL